MGKRTISMAVYNSKLLVITRRDFLGHPLNHPARHAPRRAEALELHLLLLCGKTQPEVALAKHLVRGGVELTSLLME